MDGTALDLRARDDEAEPAESCRQNRRAQTELHIANTLVLVHSSLRELLHSDGNAESDSIGQPNDYHCPNLIDA